MKPTHFGLFLLMAFAALGLGECGYKTTTVDSGGGPVTVANPTTTITVNDEADATIASGDGNQVATDNGINNDDGQVTSTPSGSEAYLGIPGCSSQESFEAGLCNG